MRPEDDYTHPVGPEPNFNESMYVHFHDPAVGLGGFVRIANRPNEGRGEVTVCLFLPDGGLAFSYARPEVRTNERLAAAGMALRVREPMKHLDVSFSGTVARLADPTMMDEPRAALGGSPRVPCTIDLAVRALAPEFAHSFDTGEGSFAPNHYEQLHVTVGRIALGDAVVEIHGHGLRDHSWGPRYWQTPWFYRWVHGCTDGFGFMGAWFGNPDGSAVCGGFVWDGDALVSIDEIRIATRRDGREEQSAVNLFLRAGDRDWTVRGRALATVPLRNRRPDGAGGHDVTRIVESLMIWSLDDGRALHGMAEYLDQIRDGRPVGLQV
ncbi:hypothetical protein GCM10010472_19550 [Pseudonocardia halophobica]|uniref:Uncharacterized protein n=1 Tax=Pseudonocardia halophobica TaxID=29401 RepID=A0A9W6L0B4_9PSEU|nr:hypothetical protein [Pseudonocardia halophobica]GLL09831.1 hypothetical protein GCM10017577_09710 [Pseudonocardia halophobica]